MIRDLEIKRTNDIYLIPEFVPDHNFMRSAAISSELAKIKTISVGNPELIIYLILKESCNRTAVPIGPSNHQPVKKAEMRIYIIQDFFAGRTGNQCRRNKPGIRRDIKYITGIK